MSNWMKRRFWTDVAITKTDMGYGVNLDGRMTQTPLKAVLSVPTRAFADQIAAEWRGVGEMIDPTKMPYTRAANAAIDKLTKQKDEVVDMLAEYGASDLLCYRASSPDGLVAKQAEAWDPALDWAAQRFGQRLNVTRGILPVAQPKAPLAAMKSSLSNMTKFQLSGAHDLITISGSLVLAFAVIENAMSCAAAWSASRIDEDWQISEWGADSEAEAASALKKADFERARHIFRLAKD